MAGDFDCHLNRISKWHDNFESYISLLIRTLNELNDSSVDATKECTKHYLKTIELTKAKTRFTFEVSHELKAPLASVYNIINLILDGYLDEDIAKQKELLTRAKIRIKSITDLLNDLLIFARLEERAEDIEKEELNLEKIFSLLTEEMNETAQKDSIEIKWNICDDCPHIRGNAPLIRRAFANLIHNALKYSKPGGLVEVTGENDDGLFMLSVKDNGIGIKEEELPEIFDIFFRGENSRTDLRKEGMGLGLSLVKRIIAAHGGCIKVKSELHKGTTLEVRMPGFQKKEK